jgi:hypothetical protein
LYLVEVPRFDWRNSQFSCRSQLAIKKAASEEAAHDDSYADIFPVFYRLVMPFCISSSREAELVQRCRR